MPLWFQTWRRDCRGGKRRWRGAAAERPPPRSAAAQAPGAAAVGRNAAAAAAVVRCRGAEGTAAARMEAPVGWEAGKGAGATSDSREAIRRHRSRANNDAIASAAAAARRRDRRRIDRGGGGGASGLAQPTHHVRGERGVAGRRRRRRRPLPWPPRYDGGRCQRMHTRSRALKLRPALRRTLNAVIAAAVVVAPPRAYPRLRPPRWGRLAGRVATAGVGQRRGAGRQSTGQRQPMVVKCLRSVRRADGKVPRPIAHGPGADEGGAAAAAAGGPVAVRSGLLVAASVPTR
eukprot:364997-Chlamydomonas_euryale.AAC.7